MKIQILLLLVVALYFWACTKQAKGCFTYEQTNNSLTVIFDASCSQNSYQYNWTIHDNDSLWYETKTTNPVMTYSFKKTGDYFIGLVVQNKKGKSHAFYSMEIPMTTKTITVK